MYHHLLGFSQAFLLISSHYYPFPICLLLIMPLFIYAPLLFVLAWLYKVSPAGLIVGHLLMFEAAIIAPGPLGSIPGLFLNRWANLPLKIRTLQGRKIYYVDDLHIKYGISILARHAIRSVLIVSGPVIRISPTEIAYADLSSTREIHKIGSGYLKSQFYPDFTGESAELRSLQDYLPSLTPLPMLLDVDFFREYFHTQAWWNGSLCCKRRRSSLSRAPKQILQREVARLIFWKGRVSWLQTWLLNYPLVKASTHLKTARYEYCLSHSWGRK